MSESRSGSAWQRRKRKLLGSLQSVCRVVRKQVPPTFSRTHFPGSVAGGPPLDGAAPLEGLQRRKGAEGGRPRLSPPAGDAGSSQGPSVAILARRRKVPRERSPRRASRAPDSRERACAGPRRRNGRGGRSLASGPAGGAGLPAAARSCLPSGLPRLEAASGEGGGEAAGGGSCSRSSSGGLGNLRLPPAPK